MMEKRLPILCNKKRLYRLCYMCTNMSAECNQHGKRRKRFLYPQIDSTKCIGCLLCEKKCPINESERTTNPSPTVYACWHKNMDIRLKSSSGGVFSAIAEYILKNGGIVWGAAYSKDLTLTYQYVENIEDLDRLRRSKYVQAEVNDSFKLIKEQLRVGKNVLFTGTSCHIRGLYSYLPKNYKKT